MEGDTQYFEFRSIYFVFVIFNCCWCRSVSRAVNFTSFYLLLFFSFSPVCFFAVAVLSTCVNHFVAVKVLSATIMYVGSDEQLKCFSYEYLL